MGVLTVSFQGHCTFFWQVLYLFGGNLVQAEGGSSAAKLPIADDAIFVYITPPPPTHTVGQAQVMVYRYIMI